MTRLPPRRGTDDTGTAAMPGISYPCDLYLSGEYLQNHPGWHVEHSSFKAEQIAKILTNNNLLPGTVAEIGCGAGEVLNRLRLHLPATTEFFGYEISPQAFELCKKKEKKNLYFSLYDMLAEDTPFFDLVMAIDVFEHVDDYFGFLRKLRDKGKFKIFHIPLDMSVSTLIRGAPIMEGRYRTGHLHYFFKETALATLRDTGYQIIDHFYTAPDDVEAGRRLATRLLHNPRKWLFAINQDLTVRLLGGFSLMVLAR
ncbi:MAG: class I SAM-dependent methyltransferase [Gammaproteobacteria bacterium]|nr:class I SAM-dependent methyltransferase [Gammaproteobacteria bacterium]